MGKETRSFFKALSNGEIALHATMALVFIAGLLEMGDVANFQAFTMRMHKKLQAHLTRIVEICERKQALLLSVIRNGSSFHTGMARQCEARGVL